MKENINRSISFTQFGNDLNEYELYFLKHKGMENSEETINYEIFIAYELTQYSMKSGLKELGGKGETVVTEELSQIHMRDKFCPESAKHLTKELRRDAL